ncbi:1-deoxy-D-xylulose-5-phosphate reductoisomerase [Carboxydocella sp. JDF658]|uniref:1-deoxy-D-xylulose-5-phosphate reductoisomerase n=1 Tax=Carboxydocella sp. JDF658 TaxID=1926600 RepID=UPI0009ACB70D|nr:1-deoxy-D-xylulose-5-phosphate reductoisomerase [Carboxydocella sp. JDF658]GAW30707.1 1-deoxy-D-xylulose-5-phosphate reductoisomerase [Carboxydocella sp. JDF658]
MRKIGLIGSTGSIGTQTLEVVRAQRENLQVSSLAAGRNVDLLLAQIREFKPEVVAVAEAKDAEWLAQQLRVESWVPEIYWGTEGLLKAATEAEIDLLVTAITGARGLLPTIAAIKQGTDIALANKETLVAAGELVMALAEKHDVKIIPVDSEHSAIFQCIQGSKQNEISKLILTASGGAFREWDIQRLQEATVRDALAHPNWSMGAKITIDSATMINKGLEVIEAHWLFGIPYEQIQVLLHPQSIIHSLVEFCDGSQLAQLGLPDMRLPIQYALSWPQRWSGVWPRLDLASIGSLTFSLPDYAKYPGLKLAYLAGQAGGLAPTIFNAANEVAVTAFLNEEIKFVEIVDVIAATLDQFSPQKVEDLEVVLHIDQQARYKAAELIKKGR